MMKKSEMSFKLFFVRMEEGASSVEVQELQLKLESADKKNQRIMEAFKKTSKVS